MSSSPTATRAAIAQIREIRGGVRDRVERLALAGHLRRGLQLESAALHRRDALAQRFVRRGQRPRVDDGFDGALDVAALERVVLARPGVLQHRRRLGPGRGGRHERESGHAVGCDDRDAQCDRPAERVSDQRRAVDAQRVHRLEDVLPRPLLVGDRGVAEARQVHRDHTDGRRRRSARDAPPTSGDRPRRRAGGPPPCPHRARRAAAACSARRRAPLRPVVQGQVHHRVLVLELPALLRGPVRDERQRPARALDARQARLQGLTAACRLAVDDLRSRATLRRRAARSQAPRRRGTPSTAPPGPSGTPLCRRRGWPGSRAGCRRSRRLAASAGASWRPR